MQRTLLYNIRKCTTPYATDLTIYCSVQSKMRLVGPQNALGPFIANSYSSQKIAGKINAIFWVCQVQFLHKVDLVWIPLYNGPCLHPCLVSKSFATQLKRETNHMTPLEHLKKNIGNQALFLPQQLLQQFHLKSVSFLFLSSYPIPESFQYLSNNLFQSVPLHRPFSQIFKRRYSRCTTEKLLPF